MDEAINNAIQREYPEAELVWLQDVLRVTDGSSTVWLRTNGDNSRLVESLQHAVAEEYVKAAREAFASLGD